MCVCVFYCTENLHTDCIFPLCNPTIHSITSREQRGSSRCKISRRSLKIWHLPHWHPIVCQSVVSLPYCCYNSYLNPTPCKCRWGLEQIMTNNLATSGFHLRYSTRIKHMFLCRTGSASFFPNTIIVLSTKVCHTTHLTLRDVPDFVAVDFPSVLKENMPTRRIHKFKYEIKTYINYSSKPII